MTMDRTLKISGGMLRTRSVMTRAERIEHLIEEGEFDPEKDSPLGLPKVRVRTSKAGTKSKKAEEEEAPVEGEVAPADGAGEQASR